MPTQLAVYFFHIHVVYGNIAQFNRFPSLGLTSLSHLGNPGSAVASLGKYKEVVRWLVNCLAQNATKLGVMAYSHCMGMGQEQGQGTIVFYCALPGSCPGPGSMQCV